MNKKIIAMKTVIFGYFNQSKKDFKFTMISVGIAIWGLLVISSIISGFDNVLIDSITDFYPHIIINGNHKIEKNNEIDYVYHLSFEKALIMNSDLKLINIIKTDSLKQFSKNFLNETTNKNYIIGYGLKKYSENNQIKLLEFNNILPKIQTISFDNYFKTNINSFDDNMIIYKISSDYIFDYTAIVLKNPNKATAFKEEYLKNFSSLTWKESNDTLTQTVEIDSLISLLITVFIVLMASFSVSNSLTFSFLKRKREIGLLRITGFSEKNIKNIFLIESLITSIIGYITGTLFSFLTVFILNIIKIPLPKGIFYIDYLPVKYDFFMMFISFIFTVFIIIIISIINLKRLMKFDYIEVLKDGE